MPYTHIIPQNLDGDSGGTILARAATAKEIKSWFLSDPYYLEVKVSRDCKKITYACTGPGVKKWREATAARFAAYVARKRGK